MSKSIKEYRNELNADDIRDFLENHYDVSPVRENDVMIVYPTVCHNLDPADASPKLYYYKKDNIFKCYTECDQVFDIFQLIENMEYLRGRKISVKDAIEMIGVNPSEGISDTEHFSIKKQLDYLYEMNNIVGQEEIELTTYSKKILDRYIYDLEYLKPWINEGISPETLRKYKIKFDTIMNAIIIPYFTDEKKLVGIRGRFLSPDAKAKYMPIKYGDKYLAHPTSKILYGLDVNKKAIQKKKIVILFEGEKSVMKMDTLYGDENVSLAVSGQTISKDHIQLLLKYGVKDVIIAFDRDYKSYNELEEKIQDYKNKFGYIRNFFNVSIIADIDFLLEHKDSPIDDGEETFNILMKERLYM